MLPKPNASFTLPSVHDGTEVDCRLYFPHVVPASGDLMCRGVAIFAHPYAPLGGSYDDPVVNHVGGILSRQGYLLVTFNFRGADQSAGKTSWSGKGELGDYVSVYLFVVAFLSSPGISDCVGVGRTDEGASASLVLGGYSYGSMMATHLPSLSYIQKTLACTHEPTAPEIDITSRAQELALSFLDFHATQVEQAQGHVGGPPPSGGVIMGGSEHQSSGRRRSTALNRSSIDLGRIRRSVDRLRHRPAPGEAGSGSHGREVTDPPIEQTPGIRIRVSYLLVSPLLGPVAGLASMYSRLKFKPRRSRVDVDDMTPDQALRSHPSIVIYGSKDMFSSPKKIKKWCEALQQGPGSRLKFCEVSGAGHFWHDDESASGLEGALVEWLTSEY